MLYKAAYSRSPSWGAWIEIRFFFISSYDTEGRSPSWGAWIEICTFTDYGVVTMCRSPSWGAWIEIVYNLQIGDMKVKSLPLVGSVD